MEENKNLTSDGSMVSAFLKDIENEASELGMTEEDEEDLEEETVEETRERFRKNISDDIIDTFIGNTYILSCLTCWDKIIITIMIKINGFDKS